MLLPWPGTAAGHTGSPSPLPPLKQKQQHHRRACQELHGHCSVPSVLQTFQVYSHLLFYTVKRYLIAIPSQKTHFNIVFKGDLRYMIVCPYSNQNFHFSTSAHGTFLHSCSSDNVISKCMMLVLPPFTPHAQSFGPLPILSTTRSVCFHASNELRQGSLGSKSRPTFSGGPNKSLIELPYQPERTRVCWKWVKQLWSEWCGYSEWYAILSILGCIVYLPTWVHIRVEDTENKFS